MYIIVVGGGKVGAHLSSLLQEAGHEVTLAEQRKEQCAKLREITDLNIVCGDGCEPYVLDEAGISKADAVVAVTGHDEDNLVICLLSKFEYEAPLVIARINNPKNAWLFTQKFGVDIPVSNTQMIAKLLLERMTIGDIVTFLKLRKGDMSLAELTISEGSKVIGKQVSDIELPPDCVFVTIIRGDELLIPKGTTVLEANDEILVVTSINREAEIAKLLS